MRNLGCTLMILPALAFVIYMVIFGDVGPVEGTTMWVIFFIGMWIVNLVNKEDEDKRELELKSKKPVKSVLNDPVKKQNLVRNPIANKDQKPQHVINQTVIEKQIPIPIPEIEIIKSRPKFKEVLNHAVLENRDSINEILRVNYTSSKSEKTDSYPIFRYPKPNTVVRSYRFGTTKRRGFKDPVFQRAIEEVFGDDFIVSGEFRINTGKDTRPFEPDIALVAKKNFNLRIDIEIDEPYAGVTRQPTHCKGDDTLRDIYFVDRGWIVIRFSEYQVHLHEKMCLKFISDVIGSIIENYQEPEILASIKPVDNEVIWDTIQAQEWEKSDYREYYLDHVFQSIEEKAETSERDFNEQELNEEKLVKSTEIGFVDEKTSIGYNLTNFHPRDHRIEFYPEAHVYTLDRIPTPSASTVISKFFPEFNSLYWSRKKAIDRLIFEGIELTESNIQKVANQIAKGWKEQGEKSAQEGTLLHEQIEKYFLDQDYEQTEEFQFFEQFVDDHPEVKPFRSEWRIFDEEHHIAGTIDLVARSESGFDIYDWKRSKNIIDKSTGNPIIKKTENNQVGVGFLSDIYDTSYNRYCLQQSLYKYILEKNYNLKISKMYLVVLHPEYDGYYKVEVPYLKNKIELILNTL